MALGLTRREQWALLGVVGIFLLGVGVRACREGAERSGSSQVVCVNDQGAWEKLADYPAGQRPKATGTPNAPGETPPAQASPTPKPASAEATPLATPGPLTPRPAPPSLSPDGGLELNQATAEELDRLPGIGPAKARAIIEARQARGGFASLDQLEEVRGIGPKLLAQLRPYLRLDARPAPPAGRASRPTTPANAIASTTASLATLPGQTAARPAPSTLKTPSAALIDINHASPEELEKLDGVGPVLAGRIARDRQTRGAYTRPEDLLRVKGIGVKTLQKFRDQVTVK